MRCTMEKELKVGVDVGSTTIKVVVLDEQQNILYSKYQRHYSEIKEVLQENLTALKDIVGTKVFSLALTGSAGMGIAQRLHLPFVQEVIACASAVKQLIPDTDTAVELGGEDAKITYFGAAMEQRMNGACAGGTGSFIDHMAFLLDTDATGLNKLAAAGKQIYTIASRCGVFAKTDVQALMNDGVGKADIALSILQSVVNQTIGNLAQGRPIDGKVAFLGGPLHFLPELKKRFIATLKIKAEDIMPVKNGIYFVAIGAALGEETTDINYQELEEKVEENNDNTALDKKSSLRLFNNQAEYQIFKARHAQAKVRQGDLATYQGPVYLGIDAGSTTTKIVAMGKDKEVLYTDYGSNEGSPLTIVVDELQRLYAQLPQGAYIASTLTTGYGEGLVKAAIHADAGEVETIAHMTAAREFCPEVSCVLDIGGQDMKCFLIRDGAIGKITLNEACSAGCGSFLQNFAQGLNMPVGEFAQKALAAQAPIDLGTRCTVFMNSRVKQAQKEGSSVGDISAGLAISIIKNALFKVMQLRDVSVLGEHIVVQGGTFYNDAVLRAIEKLLDKDVIRPDIAGLMGAYGAALLAQEGGKEKSSLLTSKELSSFTTTTTSYRCKGCGNQCRVTVQKFSDGAKYFTGNRCERGAGQPKKKNKAPNIYDYKYERLFSYYRPLKRSTRGRIGIPRVLNMFEDYPFWFTFFTKLGYEVVISDKSTPEMFQSGLSTIPSESLCFPAKLVHGHIVNLVNKGVKKIFYPCIPYNLTDAVNDADNTYNCPVVAGYPENIAANMDILRQNDVRFYKPYLPLGNAKRLEERLQKELKAENLDKKEIKAALEAAYNEWDNYKQDVRAFGARVLKELEGTDKKAVVLVGRPYHIDPEINHGIPEMIQSYGLPVLSEDSIYHMPVPKEHLDIVNQWSYHARLYHAASYVAAHPNLALIQFNSFGCGLDAITTGQVQAIMESHKRLYTLIKLDEVSNLGAARIRLRSLLAAWARRKPLDYQEVFYPERARFTEECKKIDTIIAPQMAPIQFRLIAAALKRFGYKLEIPPLPGREVVDIGLRYVNNDMCYPAIVTVGQLLSLFKEHKYDPDHTAIMLFQSCGACRATNYLKLTRQAFKEAGMPQVPIFAGVGLERDSFKLDRASAVNVGKGIIYGDLLMRVVNRTKPYELTPGSTEQLFEQWMTKLVAELSSPSTDNYKKNVKAIVADFDKLPVQEEQNKPKVGIVGEILVKYHAMANNHVADSLVSEGAEVVMPDLMDFLLYMLYDDIIKHDLLAGTYWNKLKAEMEIQVMQYFRHPMERALKASKHFTAPWSIFKIAKLAQKHISLGNMAGEGWFLTGEMLKLLESGIANIVCLQPFGCLPNHIVGKGMFRELREAYPACNIVAIDCDAGASEVNQLNRLKLMLSVAKEKMG